MVPNRQIANHLLSRRSSKFLPDVGTALLAARENQRVSLQQFSSRMPTFTAPLILGVATACLYTSVLRHPSSHLTRKSAVYLLLLALQVSIQPKLSQAYLRPDDNKVVVALMEEIVKTSIAFLLFGLQDADTRRLALAGWSLSSSLSVAALPAALYALQSVLTYNSLQRLDSVTFNGLSQLKTASAAIWCFLLLGTTQSRQQMLAIAILILSAVIFQQPTTSRAAIGEHDSKPVSVTGMATCLAATFVSGLAGALSQRGVQLVGRHSLGKDPFLFAGEVSFYSALCLLLSLRPSRRPSASNHNAIRGYLRSSLWIPVTVKAMGGIVTVLVHKYAGSVLKGFALVLGLVLSGMYKYDSLTRHQIVATVLVLLSSWMHFTSP